MPDPILSIRDLTVEFKTEDGVVQAVSDVSYDLMPGEVLGLLQPAGGLVAVAAGEGQHSQSEGQPGLSRGSRLVGNGLQVEGSGRVRLTARERLIGPHLDGDRVFRTRIKQDSEE